jgi:hypothetical protein
MSKKEVTKPVALEPVPDNIIYVDFFMRKRLVKKPA